MNKIKNCAMNLAKKNVTFRRISRKSLNFIRKFYYLFCLKFSKTNKNIIVFDAYMGRKYSCSPRAIYEYMIDSPDFDGYTFVWAFKDTTLAKNYDKLSKAKIVKFNSKDYYKYCAICSTVITNSRLPDNISFRDNQIYVQCWHGTPLKRLGYDIKVEGGNALNTLDDLCDKYKRDAIRFTHLLSPSRFTSEKLTSAFNLKENNPNTQIIELGYPRNDFLYSFNEQDVIRVKKYFNILNTNKKVILYAPTWRDNNHTTGVGYTYDLGVDFDYLERELRDEYIILFRPHYFIANSFDFSKYERFVYDASNYDEINDLYILADILITDYSSVFFDFANLKKPMIFYMYDLEEYSKILRGFYISLKNLPGPITKTQEDLVDAIKNNNFVYGDKYKIFNDTFNYLDNANSSQRVCDYIFRGK